MAVLFNRVHENGRTDGRSEKRSTGNEEKEMEREKEKEEKARKREAKKKKETSWERERRTVKGVRV